MVLRSFVRGMQFAPAESRTVRTREVASPRILGARARCIGLRGVRKQEVKRWTR